MVFQNLVTILPRFSDFENLNQGGGGPALRAHSHYVKFGLTRLRFSKKMAKTRRQTHLRQRRGGACVDAVASAFFAFLVV